MNLANIITISRIIMVPLIAVLLLDNSFWTSFAATLLFIVATVSDWLDGYLARNYNMESNLGKLLDPLADKLLIATVLIFLIPLDRVPAWVVAVIVGRELAVTGVRGIASESQVIIAANWLGKYKTAFQCAACIPLLMHYSITLYPFAIAGPAAKASSLTIQFHAAGIFFLWIAAFFTIWSGFDYIYNYIRQSLAEV